MKKVTMYLIMGFLVVLLTGCVKSQTAMVIKKDKSMDFSATYLISDSLLSLTDGENDLAADDEQVAALEERGYQVIEYSNDGYTGVKISKTISNIDDVSTTEETEIDLYNNLLDTEAEDSAFFTLEKGFLKNKYTVNIVYDLTTEDDEDDSSLDLSAYTSMIDIEYSVTLPCKALTSNSSDISDDQLTYNWKASYGSLTNINYSFELINYSDLIILVSGIVVLVSGIAAGTLLIMKKNKKKPNKK